jgi:endonuclease-3
MPPIQKTESHPGDELILLAARIYDALAAAYGIPSWGVPSEPLDELVNTILSQNTNDRNRDRAYQALRGKFPTWEDVHDAPQGEVIDAVRPAGLAPKKGPRIQAILRQITEERGNLDLDFLREMKPEEARCWLLKFNGVGPKTAAIVMQFSLAQDAFPVDTHIYRVTARLGLRPASMSREAAHQWLEKAFDPSVYGPAHLNLIRLGRETCHPRKPDCPNCPVRKYCSYYKNQP